MEKRHTIKEKIQILGEVLKNRKSTDEVIIEFAEEHSEFEKLWFSAGKVKISFKEHKITERETLHYKIKR